MRLHLVKRCGSQQTQRNEMQTTAKRMEIFFDLLELTVSRVIAYEFPGIELTRKYPSISSENYGFEISQAGNEYRISESFDIKIEEVKLEPNSRLDVYIIQLSDRGKYSFMTCQLSPDEECFPFELPMVIDLLHDIIKKSSKNKFQTLADIHSYYQC